MNETIETQMLDALELFHYAYKFRNHQFVLVLEEGVAVEEIMLDIRMLYSAHIKVIVLYRADLRVDSYFNGGSQCGFKLRHSAPETPERALSLLRQVPVGDAGAVVGLDLSTISGADSLTDQALQIATGLRADKVFFLGADKGLSSAGKFLSHPQPQELEKCLDTDKTLNISSSKLRLMLETTRNTGIEIIILAGQSGTLFEEIFTHRGSGTLLTDDYPNLIRQGREDDLTDLLMLIKHEMQQGSILPVSEDSIASNIHNYFVYTVNDSIVASATLVDYGTTAELAKFCTLPRYQGKGRAKQLALQMIEKAAELNKDYVFALSVNPKMWDFFLGLGFVEISRKELPRQWQQQYDFKRSSKAFKKML